MKISEVTNHSISNPEPNLVTALELIRNRYKDRDQLPKISTQSLINLVLNTDRTFNYDALVQSAEENPAVKNLIKSYNKDTVELRPAGDMADDEGTTTITPDGETTDAPVDTVSNMAKRAAKQRGAAV